MSTVLNDLLQIWKDNGIDPLENTTRITEADLQAAETLPSQAMRGPIWYGKYCGPATVYKDNPPPVDCLDLACKFHDTYFDNPNSDYALMKSAEYIIDKGMVKNKTVLGYVKNIDSPIFCAGSTLWRRRKRVLIAAIVLFVCVFGIGIVSTHFC